MTKLTTDMRKRIAIDILRHKFTNDVDALRARRAALAAEIYDDVFRKADRDRIDALPKGWLPECSAASVQFGEAGRGYQTIDFDGDVESYDLRKLQTPNDNNVYRRVPNKLEHSCWKVYPADHKLTRKSEQISADVAALAKRVEEARAKLKTALYSYSTVAALLKAWPEIEPFVKAHVAVPATLPAIPVASLNAMLDLPAGQAA